ncbi:hypothetical protein PHYSODRAFT_517941 [Phytophthora sojae]|uniref:SWIM-type domain-containing protein n=1 Tax=Phytophthora sojae (strain P6497) TaxID=1094619 RepID=G4ZXG1_PHYSP|nr:hypothetical protein PHYSODRAFT_517941 [Phytophthora sojae]EGZ11824.1 hypothetical protein PHYSODRAFT_517941 [Phytophthora sojae]|eukprot:XP_009532157.1 hypothetical protein PHYSODRAFT_517941 [Phytophthora sojae]
MANWDSNQDEWVSYKRGNTPHLTNNTNNRIESKWGKIKDVINDSFTIDQLLSTLMTLQHYAEEQYLAEYHRVGSRPSRDSEDRELTLLALQLNTPGRATVTSPRSGEVHEVNTRTNSCNCIFMKTCLLPCRDVMYVRSTSNFETVLPPMHCFPTRWIV